MARARRSRLGRRPVRPSAWPILAAVLSLAASAFMAWAGLAIWAHSPEVIYTASDTAPATGALFCAFGSAAWAFLAALAASRACEVR